MTSSSHMPLAEASNSWAVPWKLVVTVAGSRSSSTACLILSTASPRATPGLRLKDRVTEGSWPVWLMVSGPRLLVQGGHAVQGHQLAGA